MTRVASLSADAHNVLAMLNDAFTNKHTFMLELISNSRRAGATEVSITTTENDDGIIQSLAIQDNGSGIDNFDALISVAVSGWDNDTQADESPFGVGFMSSLMAVEHVVVHSGNSRMESMTDAIFDIMGAPVDEVDERLNGTRVELTGLKHQFALKEIEGITKAMLRHYPVAVTLNGERVSGEPAPIQYEAEKDGVRLVVLNKAKTMQWLDGSIRDDLALLVQHLPVGGAGIKRAVTLASTNLVHWRAPNFAYVELDINRFPPRMPDRDSLKDANAQSDVITACLKTLIADFCREYVSDDVELVLRHYGALRQVGLDSLLNKIDVLPADCTFTINANDYGMVNFDCYEPADMGVDYIGRVTKAQLSENHVFLVDEYSFLCEQHFVAMAKYAGLVGAYCVNKYDLPDGHWLLGMKGVVDTTDSGFKTDDYLIANANAVSGSPITATIDGARYRFQRCESVDLTGSFGTVTSHKISIINPDRTNSDLVYLPDQTNCISEWEMVCYNFDHHSDADQERDEKTLEEVVMRLNAADEADLLARILRSAGTNGSALCGNAFTVSFDEYGEPTVKQAA